MLSDDSAGHVTALEWRYRDLETPLTGVMFRDRFQAGPRPGVLLIHGGGGIDEHARGQARRYAALGYVVLACDMLGDGVAGDKDRIVGRLQRLRDDPPLMVRRAQAGLAALARSPEFGGQAAAVGFCFGGMVALALARSGEPMAAAVSIHGSLGSVRPARPGAVRAKVLVCHGALDPHVPVNQVTAFAAEMDSAGADWQLVMYGGAQHGFTHAAATPGNVAGVAYHQLADLRSFAATRSFLADAFGDAEEKLTPTPHAS